MRSRAFSGSRSVREVEAAGRMESGVEEIDPDSHLGTVELTARHERHIVKLFIEIFVDHGRLVDDAVAVDQYRHFAVGVLLDQILGLVLQIDFDRFIGDVLFSQDNPCPVSVGSSVAGVEFHERNLLMSAANYHRWIGLRQVDIEFVQSVQSVRDRENRFLNA